MPNSAKFPVIALVNTFPNARYPIASVAPLAAAKSMATPFRTTVGSARSSQRSKASLSREIVIRSRVSRPHHHVIAADVDSGPPLATDVTYRSAQPAEQRLV